MNRRNFIKYIGCGCGGFLLNSCTSAPITDRKQLKLIPESKLNAQAAQIYEKVKEKEKLIKSGNTLNEIKEIVSKNKLAAIKMEVQRDFYPESGFLESIRKICYEEGIVLIFDECTSGFRESYGGLHLNYGVEPDLAMFGKTLGEMGLSRTYFFGIP